MINLKTITLTLLIFCCVIIAQAGIWESDKSRVYSLRLKAFNMYELQDQDNDWINSLIDNLQKRGTVKSHFVFVKTDLLLYLNDKIFPITVFVNKNNLKQFLAFEKDGNRFVIDFSEKTVIVPCCGGLSFHPHNNGKFVVIFDPVSKEIGGIPISSGGKEPIFKEDIVTWY